MHFVLPCIFDEHSMSARHACVVRMTSTVECVTACQTMHSPSRKQDTRGCEAVTLWVAYTRPPKREGNRFSDRSPYYPCLLRCHMQCYNVTGSVMNHGASPPCMARCSHWTRMCMLCSNRLCRHGSATNCFMHARHVMVGK